MKSRYRHGVLIENYVEDQYGLDLLSRKVRNLCLLFLMVLGQ